MSTLINDIAVIKALADKKTIIEKLKQLFADHLYDTGIEMIEAKKIYSLLTASDGSISTLSEIDAINSLNQLDSFFVEPCIDIRYEVHVCILNNQRHCFTLFKSLLRKTKDISQTFRLLIKHGIDINKSDTNFLNHLKLAFSSATNSSALWQYDNDTDEYMRLIAQSTAIRSNIQDWTDKYIFKNNEQRLLFVSNVFSSGKDELIKNMNLNSESYVGFITFMIESKSKTTKELEEAKSKLEEAKSEINVIATNPTEYAKNTLGKLSFEEKAKFLVEFVKTF